MKILEKNGCISNPRIQILGRMLRNKKASWERKLLALIGLAHIASNETIEILEKYHNNPDEEMKEYAKLAIEKAKYYAKA